MVNEKVRIKGVSKEFIVNSKGMITRIRALQDVSFTVKEGEVVAITGTSGCGKTTTLRILMGLEKQTSGVVEVSGKRVTGPGYDRGMIFQHAELLPWRTALENVEFGLEVKGVSPNDRKELARYYLGLVGLEGYFNSHPHQLSGGMKQRVGIARALAIDPEVLLMDEPFGALDAQTRETLQDELLKIHDQTKKTIIFVTHDLDEAVLLADKVVVMFPHPGRIHEVVEINIPRPRKDVIEIRGSDEFIQKRYYIWKTLKTAVSLSTSEGV